MKKFLIATIAAAALPAMAFAKGPTPAEPVVVSPAPVAAPALNWAGGYAGLSLGYGRSTHSLPGATLPNTSGAIGGLVGGYNWQNGNLVFGAEGTVLAGRLSQTSSCANPIWDCSSRVSMLASLRARVGVATGNTLVFATVGPAMARVRHASTDGVVRFADTNTLRGVVIGVGAEHAMASGWNLRGDLEHYRFGRKDYALDVPYPNVRTRVNAARLTAVYRF